MKSILLDVRQDTGFETRLQTSLDMARLTSGHLTCVHSTPTSSYVATDVFGGAFVIADLVDALVKQDAAIRSKVEQHLQKEDVAWEYHQLETDPVGGLIGLSYLNDVIVMGRSADPKLRSVAASEVGEALMHVRCPILVVPEVAKPIDFGGTAVIAWNGSFEAAHAVRQATPLLTFAREVQIVCLEDSKAPLLPPLAASKYLARHGVASKVERIEAEKMMVEFELEKAAIERDASYLVMGAYSRSRAREFLFGGVTRYMLQESNLPLLMAH